jgi:hypothetical protein
MPRRVQDMLALYQDYATANNVRPVHPGYNEALQGVLNGVKDRFGPQLLLALLSFLVLTPFYLVYRYRRRASGQVQ